MGIENFRKALNYYLLKHQYSNAETDDLLKAFDLFSYKPVRKIMNAWLKRSGYPMLKVRQNGNCYSLKQEKFSINGVNSEEEKKMLWKIPMIYKFEMNGESKKLVFRKRERSCFSKNIFDTNVDAIGLYRTQYTSD
ncbi:puromycin-sensitive aminopeptidase-like isoform X2, partial [Leptotrombidium deliense]